MGLKSFPGPCSRYFPRAAEAVGKAYTATMNTFWGDPPESMAEYTEEFDRVVGQGVGSIVASPLTLGDAAGIYYATWEELMLSPPQTPERRDELWWRFYPSQYGTVAEGFAAYGAVRGPQSLARGFMAGVEGQTAESLPLVTEGALPGLQRGPQVVFRVDPRTLRWSQTTAGGGGRADALRAAMAESGWVGDPIDAVRTTEGLVTLDHTRAAVAIELGLERVPVQIHLPSDPLPSGMLARKWNRSGQTARTWGEAVELRGAGQDPLIGPAGSPEPPLPRWSGGGK